MMTATLNDAWLRHILWQTAHHCGTKWSNIILSEAKNIISPQAMHRSITFRYYLGFCKYIDDLNCYDSIGRYVWYSVFKLFLAEKSRALIIDTESNFVFSTSFYAPNSI